MKLHSANDSLNTHTNQIMWRAIELILGIRMARLLYVWCQVDQFSALQKEARFQHGSWDLIKSEVLLYLFQQFIWKPSFKAEATCHYSPSGSQNLADLELSGGSRCQEGMMMTFLSLFFEKRNNYFPEFLHSNWGWTSKKPASIDLDWWNELILYRVWWFIYEMSVNVEVCQREREILLLMLLNIVRMNQCLMTVHSLTWRDTYSGITKNLLVSTSPSFIFSSKILSSLNCSILCLFYISTFWINRMTDLSQKKETQLDTWPRDRKCLPPRKTMSLSLSHLILSC